ncbi:MAG: DUF1829 domain-containing protein, partial [Carboxydocellales bacterium]
MKEKDFINSYIDWLKSKINLKEVNGYYEITTPFLDRHNDHLQIYVKQTGNKIFLTDDGYTISDLVLSGCDVSSQRRKNVMQTILNGFGVQLDGEALVVEARADNFPQKKHALLQAMISVNDMFMLSQHRVASVFLEDVENFLDHNEVRYTPSVQFIGKSGFSHTFDFVIPSSKKNPERLIRAINTPTREKAETIMFAWNDTRDIRKREAAMLVFINDLDKNIRPDIVSAFTEYDIRPILWTQRQQHVGE